jgi:hypothetical protein
MINRALGTLEPVIFFENSSGEIMLPPTTEDARWLYGSKYSREGWEWREAGTLPEVDRLQKRMVESERRRDEREAQADERSGAQRWQAVSDNLRQRMISSSTSAYEREFIQLYLQLREEKRDRHRQRFKERTYYLVAREMDEAHSSAAHLMKEESGDQWERGV